MEVKELFNRALEIRKKYEEFEKNKIGRVWTNSEFMEGLVKNTGNLMYAVMGKEGTREVADVDNMLDHELSDCLWALIVLADKYNIDIEKSFMDNMDKLDKRLAEGRG